MMPVYMQNVRLSFPHITEPQAPQTQEGSGIPKYRATLLLDPTDPGNKQSWDAFWKEVNDLAVAKWDAMASTVLDNINRDRKSRSYSQGEEHRDRKTMEVYDGYAGKYVIVAISERPPQLFTPDGNIVQPWEPMPWKVESQRLYGGCYVNALVQPWIQDNTHGRGVRVDLVGIQFARDGDAFGRTQVDAAQYFKPIPGAPPAVQQQPGFGQQQPGFGQQQPGFGQQQPGFGQQQPGFGQQQPPKTGNGFL